MGVTWWMKCDTDAEERQPLAPNEDDDDEDEPRPPQNPPPRSAAKYRVGVFTLVALTFFNVAGGPYGTEGLIKSGGPLFTLLALLLVPWFWGVPIGLLTSELSTLFPQNGGYTLWVAEAFGEFWGFQEGFVKWVGGVIDNALYPVMMLEYFEAATGIVFASWSSYVIKFLIATALTAINLTGLEVVGAASSVVLVLVLVPFLLLAMVGLDDFQPDAWITRPEHVHWGTLLHNVLWNFNGFDSVSTMTGEVSNPHQAIPRALLLATVLIMFTYLVPVLVTTALDPDWEAYKDGHYTEVATSTAGVGLTAVFSASATLSCAGMFIAEMAADSYQLLGMAQMGLIPRMYLKRSRRFDTPWPAVLTAYLIIVIMIALPMRKLIEIDNWFYSAAFLLQLGALLKLRVSRRVELRPAESFKIPLGITGLVLMYIPTFLLAVFSLVMCAPMTHCIAGTVCIFGVAARLGLVSLKL